MNENNKGIIISKPEELYMEIDKGYMYRDKDTGKKVKMIFKYDTNIQTTLKKNNSTFTLKKHK